MNLVTARCVPVRALSIGLCLNNDTFSAFTRRLLTTLPSDLAPSLPRMPL